MHTDHLFSVLSSYHPITEPFKQALDQRVTTLSLPRNYLLLEAPAVADHAYFLLKGFAMSYSFVHGRKQVEAFWKPGQIIVSAKSFFERVPSNEFIQLRDHSDLLCIDYKHVLELLHLFPEANAIQRGILNRYYEQARERLRDLQHLSTISRYQKLTRDFPGVEQHVTQELIASYLGIAPQSLSRMKRRHR